MNYKINYECYADNFVLPKSIINDDFSKIDAIYLKTIILIFNNSYKSFSASLIAGILNEDEKTIEQIIYYWIEKGVLLKTENDTNVNTTSKDINQEVKPMVIPQAKKSDVLEQEQMFLLQCTESLLKRPISSTEYKSIIHIIEYVKLPADVILMAIEYCISINKFTPQYFEKVCVNWVEDGITTHQLAESHLTMLKDSYKNEEIIKKMFGLTHRSLTDYEQQLIYKWINEYNFSFDIIKIAYEKTIAATNKVAFAYINKILSNWYENGFKTLADVTGEANNSSRSYSIDELDRFWNDVPTIDR